MRKVIKFIKSIPMLYKICHRIYSLICGLRRGLTRIIKHRFFYFFLMAQTPLSNKYGLDRGKSICRYYIENFLEDNKNDIQGNCLEVRSNYYTSKFGGDKVKKSDVLDIDQNLEGITIYGDLRNLDNVQDNTYDCIILTQVLQYIDDCETAIKECHRILKPSGVLLATVPSLGPIDPVAGIKGDFWRFTVASIEYIFSKFFAKDNLKITSQGNVLVGVGYWVGLAKEEMSKKDLDYNDPDFPCFILVRAIKK